MRLLFVTFFCLLFSTMDAHPSWGIAVSKDGNVYFVDVLHNDGTLWRLNDKGQLFEVIHKFHAHDLHIDNRGNIWLAENLWIQGVLEDEGQHTLLKIDPSSAKIDTIVVTLDKDLFSGSSFAVAQDESIYFINENKVFKYKNGQSKLIADYDFKRLKSIMIDEKGSLWITDSGKNNGTLYEYTTQGFLKAVATQLMPKKPSAPLFKEKNQQFLIGIAQDDIGNMYVSENAGCRIIKINPLGEKSTFYQSSSLWSPVNVAFHKGDAYIMEVGFNKDHKGPRIIKKSASGGISRLVNIETIPDKQVRKEGDTNKYFSIPNWVYFGIGLLVFAAVIIISVKKQYKAQ